MQAGAEHRDQQDRQQHRREGHPDIDQARDQRVDEAAEKAGEEAEQRADEAGEPGGDERDRKRDLRAEDDARKHVAPEPVGPEQIAGFALSKAGRRHGGENEVLRQRIHRRDQGRREGENDQEHDEATGADDLGVAQQPLDDRRRLRAGIHDRRFW